MNLPNKLTLFRVILVPVIAAFIYTNQFIFAAILFILAVISDFLDGYLARRNGTITVFGQFLDPVADKLVVIVSMIMLVEKNILPGWAVSIVALREFAVDGLRLVAAAQNKVVPASMLGKIKTNLQFLCVLGALIRLPSTVILILSIVMAAATLLSGADYFIKLRDVFFKNNTSD